MKKNRESAVIGILGFQKPVCTVVAVYNNTGTVLVYDMKCRLALRAKSGAFGAVCVWWGHDFRAQLALRAKTGAFGAPSYRTGTGNQKRQTHPVITDGRR